MAQAKIIKIPNGEAFIEIGYDYVRIGTGDGSFFILDKNSINAGANTFNYQLSLKKVIWERKKSGNIKNVIVEIEQ